MASPKNPFIKIETQLRRAVNDTIPKAIGRMAVNHFKDSFDKQKFNDAGEAKWADVKRRDPESNWYGFKLGNKARRPLSQGGSRRRKFKDGREVNGNFSRARTTNKIMQVTNTLQGSIFVQSTSPRQVVIASSHPAATLLNNGGRFRVFGKATATMPKRQFMGPSRLLNAKLRKLIRTELKRAIRG